MTGVPLALMVVFGAVILFALLGLASSLLYQWRMWRRRRAIEGRR